MLHKDSTDNDSVNNKDCEDDDNFDKNMDDEKSKPCPQSICILFKKLSNLSLHYTFPNMFLVTIALCTLPIGSASAERKFSKMKLIKTRLRSTMDDCRLQHMMLLSCESDNMNKIDFDQAINRMGMKSKTYMKQFMPS